jgi:sortase B
MYWVTIGILSLIIIVCGTKIAQKLISDAQDKAYYDNLMATMLVPTGRPSIEDALANRTEPTVSEPNTTEPVQTAPTVTEPTVTVPAVTEPIKTEPITTDPVTGNPIMEHLISLYNKNTDLVGFIEIPGTKIKYPVVQSKYQANFYLRKNFNKVGAACGTIYVREACDVNKPSDNVTIYGHKMTNGTMFADLHLFKDKDFWNDNRYIYFDTLTEYHIYEIFAVFLTEANQPGSFNYHLFDDARDTAEFDKYVSACKEFSYYDTGIIPQYGEKLITLSTCDKSIEEGRLVVVARRII